MARIIGEVRPRYVFVENSPALTSRGLGTVLGDLAAMGFNAECGVLGAHHVGAPHKRDRIWILATHTNIKRGRRGIESRPNMVNDLRESPQLCDGQRQAESEVADASRIECKSGAGGRRIRQGGAPLGYVADALRDGNGRRPTEAIQAHGGSLWADGVRGSHEAIDRRKSVADANRSQRERDERTQRSRSEHTHPGGAGWWESEPDVGRVAHGVASRMDRLKAIGNGQVPACAALAFRTLYRRLME